MLEQFVASRVAAPYPASGRPRANEKDMRKQALVATAAMLFVEHGYAGTSLELIAREAHVAIRTIYVKFGDKDGLFGAVVCAWSRQCASALEGLIGDRLPLADLLADAGMRLHTLLSDPLAVCLRQTILVKAYDNPPLARTLHDAGIGRIHAMLDSLFRRPAIRAQLRRPLPSTALPVLFINSIMGDQMLTGLLGPVPLPCERDVRRAVEQGVRLFLRGALC